MSFQHSMGMKAEVIDPWLYQDPAAYAPSQCRSIPITDEMRAEDARRQAAAAAAATDTAAAWRERIRWTPPRKLRQAQPSQDITRKRKKGGSGQSPEQPRRREVRKTPAAAVKQVAQKPEPVPEVVQPEPAPIVEIAPVVDQIAAAVPEVVQSAPVPQIDRLCTREGCERRLRKDNAVGLCHVHAQLQREHEACVLRRKQCSAGCGRNVHSGKSRREDGRCGTCAGKQVNKDRGQVYRQRALERRGNRTCALCPKRLAIDSASNYCTHHVKTVKFMKVTLRPTGVEELRADLLWQQLSAEDKWWVLDQVR